MDNKINDRIIRLLQLYLLGEINSEEHKELMEWCNQNKRNSLFFQQICEENLLAEEHVSL